MYLVIRPDLVDNGRGCGRLRVCDGTPGVIYITRAWPTRVKLCSNDDFSSVVCESAVEEDSALISSPHGFFHAKLTNSILWS